MKHFLYIDDRENKVAAILANEPCVRIRRLTVGDYVVIREDGIITMVIERKTYPDFAASFKDDRVANFARMIEFRANQTAAPAVATAPATAPVNIALLIEGNRPRSENEQISGIPYKCIRAKINHLRLRDNFQIFETYDIPDTAQCLLAIVRDSQSLKPRSSTIKSNACSSDAHAVEGSNTDKVISQTVARPAEIPTTRAMVCEMFSAIRGIGPIGANKLVERGISIAKYIQDKPDIARTDEVAILAKVYAVSPAIASETLAAAGSLAKLCALPREWFDTFKYANGKRKKKIGARIYECLHFAELKSS